MAFRHQRHSTLSLALHSSLDIIFDLHIICRHSAADNISSFIITGADRYPLQYSFSQKIKIPDRNFNLPAHYICKFFCLRCKCKATGTDIDHISLIGLFPRPNRYCASVP